MDHYTVGKAVDHVREVLWSKVSLKHLKVPDHERFLDIAVKFQERWKFSNVMGCIDRSTFILNVLQKLDHCCTITNIFFYSFTRCHKF
jgi:hypothetical protein